ncbi:MAG: DUF3482 domain-containing protein [Pseudohongiellaceae bacterium]
MIPVFAVVGHPNKGKSSIVSTLAQDDSVAISAQSGTTRVAEVLTVNVGNCQYRLVDTPGFQRPAKVLQWLQDHATGAEQRQTAVKKFVNDEACRSRFPDEVQLLRPIVEGAAILYVVDGSRPYGPEYEAEMEILRWTGQASMALINLIENESHIESWQQALSQYFRIVKVFNAMQADFDKQLSVLEAFSHLKDEWKEAIEALINEYKNLRERQREERLRILTRLLTDLCSYQVSQKVLTPAQAKSIQPVLEKRFYSGMRQREAEAFEQLKNVYRYRNVQSDIYDLPFGDNLFDTEKWIVWGLNRKQLVTAATLAGAATGAAVDVSLAGHTLLLGTIGGGLLAGGGAWLGANRIAEFKLLGLPLGGYEARQGPVRNRNFPYVVLGRFLFLDKALRERTHARRDRIQINEGDLASLLDQLSGTEKKELHAALDRLRRQRVVETIEEVLRPLLD